MQTTIWSNLMIAHPDDWELALVTVPGLKGRLSYADRYVQRMDVNYRPVSRPIDPEVILSRHRPKKAAEAEISNLQRTPPFWGGIVRTNADGVQTFAARCFADHRMVVEVALLWPSKPARARSRDRKLEQQILEGIEPLDSQSPMQTWQAFGLSVDVPRAYDMIDWDAKAGKILFEFEQPKTKAPDVYIQRLAMGEIIRRQGLEAWLVKQLPRRARIKEQRTVQWNGHAGVEIISAEPHVAPLLRPILSPWIQRDIAWLCPDEDRLYHIQILRRQRSTDLPLPDGMTVRCCRACSKGSA